MLVGIIFIYFNIIKNKSASCIFFVFCFLFSNKNNEKNENIKKFLFSTKTDVHFETF